MPENEPKKTCFIIMPISPPPGYDERHFADVLEHFIVPAIEHAGLEPIRPIAEGNDVIPARIIELLNGADLVLCDMSGLNPNVFFEYGIRTALNKPVASIKDNRTKIPFDVASANCHSYPPLGISNISGELDRLRDHLQKCANSGKNSLWAAYGLSVAAHELAASTADPVVTQLAALQQSVDRLTIDSATRTQGIPVDYFGRRLLAEQFLSERPAGIRITLAMLVIWLEHIGLRFSIEEAESLLDVVRKLQGSRGDPSDD